MTPDPEQRLPRELLKELIEEGSDAFRGVLEKLLNTAMQMEREEFLGARRWERSEQRRDHVNGYKAKTLSTRVGQLQIRIPQVRHLDFYPRSLERGCRSEKALKLAIAEMYVMGVSTRKVTEITEQLCGTEISASQVSRISKLLDDELEQFRNRPLGSYPVVYLDAHYEKVRRQGSIQDVAVLKATGVNCWGKREVIGVSCRLSEAEVHWREFLQQLQKRGLEGVQLIVSDASGQSRAILRPQPGAGRLDGDQSAGRLYGLSFCTFYLAAHSHQQRAGEPKPSDSPAYPGRRYLSKHRVRTTTHHRCRRGDSRRLADRETVPQPGRFQTTGESDLRSLSVKLQKNSCLAHSAAGYHSTPSRGPDEMAIERYCS